MARPGRRFKRIYEEAQKHADYWMEDLRLQFLNGILALMEEKGLSQRSLAEVMGVSEAYISRVFNGNVEKNFTIRTLVELSRAVNAEVKISVTPKVDQKAEWHALEYTCDNFHYDLEAQPLENNLDYYNMDKSVGEISKKKEYDPIAA